MILEEEVINRLAIIEDLLKKLPLVEYSTEKYGDYLLRWYNLYKVPKNSSNTSKFMYSYIRDRIIPCLGDIPLKYLTGDKIQEFLNSIKRSNTRGKIALIINGSLTKAVKLRLIEYNPFDVVELSIHRVNHYRALTLNEQSIIYNLINNKLYFSTYKILICTGMRVGEFLAVDKNSIDWEKRLINIYKTVDIHNGQLQARTKTYTSVRSIPFLPELDESLKVILSYGPITYNQVKQFFKKMYTRNAIKGLNIHSFRHTFGCMCYHVGMSDKVIQRLMGHAMLDVTMNVYVDVLGSGESPFLDYFKKYKKDVENRPTDFWRFTPSSWP